MPLLEAPGAVPRVCQAAAGAEPAYGAVVDSSANRSAYHFWACPPPGTGAVGIVVFRGHAPKDATTGKDAIAEG